MFVSQLQKDTLSIVDEMINENKTFDEIVWKLQEKGYYFMIEGNRKTLFKIYKDTERKEQEYSFVDLKKRRNGLAYWETFRLS